MKWFVGLDGKVALVVSSTEPRLSCVTSWRSPKGTIVNISSVMSERGWTGQANYSAVEGRDQCVHPERGRVELARFGIRVNAVLPGFAPTEMGSGLIDKDGKGITSSCRCAGSRAWRTWPR